MKDLQIYEAYCQNKPRSESLWRQCSDCAFFQVAPLTFCFQLCAAPLLSPWLPRIKKTLSMLIFFFCSVTQECQKKLEHKLGLDSYLLKPVQRITKYQLLLKVSRATRNRVFQEDCILFSADFPSRCSQELLKYSKGREGCDDLQEALSSILGILKAVNDSMHLIAITGYEVREATLLG